jgi:HD superfamily phosphodiesterase
MSADADGTGITIYAKIEEQAKPYLDTRQNEIHVSICYAIAKRLLSHYPDADPAVVLPAILLHDVGWKMVPEERQLAAFGPRVTDMEARRLHEIEGVRIAKEILDSIGYDSDRTTEILEIVNGHDSRDEAISLNDALVKDADKLWRFTPVGLETDRRRFGLDKREYASWLRTMIDTWFFTTAAKKIAREGLDEVELVMQCERRGESPVEEAPKDLA